MFEVGRSKCMHDIRKTPNSFRHRNCALFEAYMFVAV